MTGRPVIGLIAALLVEAKSWIKVRWDFDESSYESAWQLSFIMIALAAMVIWLDESRYTAILVLLTWMPPLLLPLQFVQSYGMKDSIRLGSFSFLAKQSRARNKRLGLKWDPVEFNFGNVLLVVTLLASSVGMEKLSYAFLPGLIILCAWALLATGRCRLRSLVPVMVLAGGIALAGQYGLENLEKWIQQMSGRSSGHFNPNSNSTLIGTRGGVRQSADIVWRLQTKPGSRPPKLLRTATYMNFIGDSWRNQRRPFSELDALIIDEMKYHFISNEVSDADALESLSTYTLRGGVRPKDPLPLPGHVSGVLGHERDEIEKNVIGTVRILPTDPVVEMDVFWNGEVYAELPVRLNEPLRLTPSERKMIRQVVKEIGLDEVVGLEAKLNLLKEWFYDEFQYTRDLTIQNPVGFRNRDSNKPTALAQFLTDVRAGHCEYFATASTLMLREVGIHSRYAIGYAVMETDGNRGSYVVRGTHGHAWVRVWDSQANEWIDFDPTPPDWFGSLPKTDTLVQKFQDGLKRIREDFYLWRTQPENEWWVMAVIGVVGMGLGSVVVFRLWRSKRDLDDEKEALRYQGPIIRTPLHTLERQARELIGERPVGVPYSEWLCKLSKFLPERATLDAAIHLHQKQRFDPAVDFNESNDQLDNLVAEIRRLLKQRAKDQVD